ncbi:MAG: YqgE/AlgH family protein, partial [Verrucomicrobiia bacterium]
MGIAPCASLLLTFPGVHEGFQTLQGKLLLDGGSLSGSFFNRTVVLICQHSGDGAFGLVLNRGAERTVGEAITDDLPERIGEQDLWV